MTRLYFDIYTNDYEHAKAVPAGGLFAMPLPHWVGEPLPAPMLQAAVFADGTTWGEQSWINELLEMRAILWRRLGEASGVLHAMSGLPSNKALAMLRWERQFRNEAVAQTPPEKRMMHDRPFSMVLKNLDENSRYFGRPAETHATIEHFIKFYDGWRADLEAAKPSVIGWSPTSPSALDLETLALKSSPLGHSHPKLVPAAFHLLRPRPPAPLPSCGPATFSNDAKKLLFASGVCGNQTWELIANFSGQVFDEGSREAFGVCTGGFTDCQGSSVAQGKELGDANIFNVPSAPSGTIGFGWLIDSWVDNNTSCNCSDPNPNGHTQVQQDHPFPTPNYFVSCQ